MTIFSSFLSYGRGKAEESRKLPILNYIHCCLQLSVALTYMVLPPLILPCDLRRVHILPLDKVVGLYPLHLEFDLSYIPDLIALKVAGTEQEKIQQIDLEFHQREYERLRNRLILSSQNSHLPDAPTAKDALNDLLVRIRLK